MSLDEKVSRLDEKLDQKHDENLERFSKLTERLIRLESKLEHIDCCLDDLKSKLFGGNGIIGILNIMETRIGVLEKWIWRTTGILAAGFGITNLILIILRNFK